MDNNLHKILTEYIKKLNSLKFSLPIIMNSIEKELEGKGTKFNKFIDEKAVIIDKKDVEIPENRTAIPIEYFKEFERQKNKIDHMTLAFDLLPKNTLVSYVSQYDAFLAELIKEFYTLKPELLNNSERELKFKDLIEFDSINEAKEYILEKEIESVLRKSHIDQFIWMEGKFNLTLTKNLDIWNEFIEITERRNLFVHNNGTVSNHYIKICNQYKIPVDNINVGDKLSVDEEYLNKAHNIFYEISLKLVHVLWRKLLPSDLEKADSGLIENIYDLLAHKDYYLSKRISDFSCQTIKRHKSDVNRRIMIINRALSYKFSGDKKETISIINKDDWTATSVNFQLAIAVLNDDYNEVYRLMKSIGNDNKELPYHIYCEWPLFEELREEKKFLEVYKEIFDKDLEVVNDMFK